MCLQMVPPKRLQKREAAEFTVHVPVGTETHSIAAGEVCTDFRAKATDLAAVQTLNSQVDLNKKKLLLSQTQNHSFISLMPKQDSIINKMKYIRMLSTQT